MLIYDLYRIVNRFNVIKPIFFNIILQLYRYIGKVWIGNKNIFINGIGIVLFCTFGLIQYYKYIVSQNVSFKILKPP